MFYMMDGEVFQAATAALLSVDWAIWHCKDQIAFLDTS